jgi:hypothetical protein
MKSSQLYTVLVLTGLLLLGGCGVIRIDSNPEAYPVRKEIMPEYNEGQTVKVSNVYEKPVIVVLLPDRVDADLKQYTDTAVALLEQGLKHENISVGNTGKKSVKLKVHDVAYDPAFWTIRADVNITAELGNGKSITVFHHNASPASGWNAVNGALTRATEKLLMHRDFVKYMNE